MKKAPRKQTSNKGSEKTLYGFKSPQKSCEDPNCPFHGSLPVHGRRLRGIVKSDKMTKTVTVEWERRILVRKYQRYSVRRSAVKAHNPACINAKQGDKVVLVETRPLSKTKNFVVINVQ